MKTFILIGKSLSHSFSQPYFTQKFIEEGVNDAEYQLFSLHNIEEIKTLLKKTTLHGFNVTIPYKSEIIPYLDELDRVAQEIGAVNCVVKKNNRWVGYNTDVIGFEKMLQEIDRRYEIYDMGDAIHSNLKSLTFLRSYAFRVLILGSGGAAKAVCYVLKQKNIPFQIVSRNKTDDTITYNEITEETIHHSSFIINTTPVGMFPNMDEKPEIPYSALNHNHILIDVIYNPEETLFLKEGRKRGALIVNGLTMFKAQAEASWRLFTR
jgi:shikimate dehydrogenase